MTDKEQIICDTYNSLTLECSGKPDTPLATQIIISGVDVSGCEYLKPYNYGTQFSCCCDNSKPSTPTRITGRGGCMYNLNCYYKQLARKTQECKKLKEENEELKIELDFYIQKFEVLTDHRDDLAEACIQYEQTLKKIKDIIIKGER